MVAYGWDPRVRRRSYLGAMSVAGEVGRSVDLEILLVEDDPTDARLLVELLQHADVCTYGLRTVNTMADGERALVEEKVDVVLLDLSLPDSDGLRSVERVLAVAPSAPIVVLTGRDDYKLGLQAIEAGAQDFLVKGGVKGTTILRCAQWAVARAAVGSRRREPARWESLERTVAAMAIIDNELKVRAVNATFTTVTGFTEDAVGGTPLTELVDVADIVEFVLDLRATLRGEAPVRLVDVRLRTKGGRVFLCRLNFARIDPCEDEPPALLLMVTPDSGG